MQAHVCGMLRVASLNAIMHTHVCGVLRVASSNAEHSDGSVCNPQQKTFMSEPLARLPKISGVEFRHLGMVLAHVLIHSFLP
jgi:predicted alpha/beta hydrolase family esterase